MPARDEKGVFEMNREKKGLPKRSPEKKKERISLFGNFGTLNIGNECTLQAIILNIRRFRPNADITCICTIPDDVQARHGVPALPISLRPRRTSLPGVTRQPKSILLRILRRLFLRFPNEIRELARMRRTLKDQDMLIMTGTGMLADGHEGPLGLPYEICKWILVAKLWGVRVLFVSVGVQPLHYGLSRWFIRASLAMSDYVCFRDRQSQQYMAELGFRKKSLVFPDLAFSLPETLSPISTRHGIVKPVVGVGLFDYRGRGANSEPDRLAYQEYLKKIADFIAWLDDNGYPVRVLIGDITYDTPVREDLQGLLRDRRIGDFTPRILDEPIASVADLFRQIDSTDIVVASRFHNLIIALILAKPVIGISYDQKIDSLMADMGLPEYCLDIADFEMSGLLDRLSSIESRFQEIPPRIKKRTQDYHATLDQQYRLIFSMASKVAGPGSLGPGN
jgi:polysaccharide pyruvyl transferase WcaK-like protein